MDTVVGTVDLAAAVGFAACMTLALVWASRGRRRSARSVAYLFAASMALLTLVSISNSLEHLGVTAALDPVEDYLEILFIPLLAYTAHAWAEDYHTRQIENTSQLLRAEHDLLSTVIDNSPTAILVVDESGAITFANERAKRTLRLYEPSEGAAAYAGTGWTLRDTRGPDAEARPGRFRIHGFDREIQEGVLCMLEWDDGRRSVLSVNARPVGKTALGSSGAIVVAFEDVTRLHGSGTD